MRQIKFRVWDNERQEFFKPIYEAYKGLLLDLSITLSGEIMRRTLKHPAEHESMFEGRYVLQQFTGLYDKNEQEIYEGDILRFYSAQKGEIVKFINGAFTVYGEPLGFVYEEGEIDAYNTKNCEIIGNIHENKEEL